MTEKFYVYAVYIFSFLCLVSCEEEYNLDTQESLLEGIVFEGVLTNEKPPYFFRLTQPASISATNNEYEGIDDAIMVVTDVTEDVRDTMQVIKPYYPGVGGIFYDYYDYYKKKNDKTSIHGMFEGMCNGVYVTTKIYGIEGHSYRLDIYYNGKHYQSDVQRMEPALVITGLTKRKMNLGEKGESIVPCISFINPPEAKNYYLFNAYVFSYTNYTLSRPNVLFSVDSRWGYSILSDEHLEENVVDYVIDDGENPLGYPTGWNYVTGDSLYVWAQTISESCYNVFDQMIKQFRTDGGAYTPCPTSIKGNISGGVFGCFRVSAASEKWILSGWRDE